MTSPTQYLFKRGHSWYFKRAVPTDLQDALGKNQIVEALRTRDLTEAQSRRWERMEYWEQRFAELRGARRPDNTMSPREAFTESLDYLRTSKASVPSSSQRGSARSRATLSAHAMELAADLSKSLLDNLLGNHSSQSIEHGGLVTNSIPS